MTSNADKRDIIQSAIAGRRSVRAFTDEPVSRETIHAILETAARAPSGTNMQPWKVYAATDSTLERLKEAVLAAHNDGKFEREQTYKYYPDKFPEPYLSRRRKVGWDMYGLLGIEKGDGAKMHAQHGENYRFFGAPVGLMFTLDARLEIGSWLDYGMFLQNIMIAARAHGLETCPQAAWAPYHKAIRPVLNIPDDELVLCGIALGHEDTKAPINKLEVDRAPVEDFTVFLD